MKALQKEKIQVILRQNANGIIYGITYVDHHTKCVFKGSHLGKQYSANAIQQRCNPEQVINRTSNAIEQSFNREKLEDALEQQKRTSSKSMMPEDVDTSMFSKSSLKLIDGLIQPEENRNANEPSEQKKFKRKRKQQQSHT